MLNILCERIDAICITSKYDGTPNVLGEAVAYKIPCLAPKNVGLSNVILLNGKGGYLYKPNSNSNFKHKLSSISIWGFVEIWGVLDISGKFVKIIFRLPL